MPRRLVATLIWIALLLVAAWLGRSLGEQQETGLFAFDVRGFVTLALPAFLFGTAPLWLQGHPLDFQKIRALVNQRQGEGTYEGWVQTLRPLLLASAMGMAAGLVCLYTVQQRGAAASAYASGWLFISAGVGFAACRIGLRLQGHHLE